jgi:predicted nucleotidyltransferase component of viral defense system
MNEAVKIMLERYTLSSTENYENALKEILQEIALLGLWRSKFFEWAAFYGGSALRILYGLDRFSEDLDFSLLKSEKRFSLAKYCTAVEEELKGFGFTAAVERKERRPEGNIESAFIKAGTLENMISIDMQPFAGKKVHPGKKLKIKLEVDIDPPGDFHTEAHYLFRPIPFSVNVYSLPSLFSGKMHALLCRSWGNRVKGRDWYDLVWYVGKDVPLSLNHLEKRMKQTGHFEPDETLTEEIFKPMLYERIKSVDFNSAKKDVENLVKDRASLSLWSGDYFRIIAEKINFTAQC